MPRKSERLRLSEVRAIFRLVGECRDLGADPEAWRSHLTRSLGDIAGGQVSMAGEAAKPADGATPGQLYHFVDHGWITPGDRDVWASYQARGGYLREPLLRSIQVFGFRHGLCARHQAVDDSTWFGSSYYNEIQRPSGVDEMLVSFENLPGGSGKISYRSSGPGAGGSSDAASAASSGSSTRSSPATSARPSPRSTTRARPG